MLCTADNYAFLQRVVYPYPFLGFSTTGSRCSIQVPSACDLWCFLWVLEVHPSPNDLIVSDLASIHVDVHLRAFCGVFL